MNNTLCTTYNAFSTLNSSARTFCYYQGNKMREKYFSFCMEVAGNFQVFTLTGRYLSWVSSYVSNGRPCIHWFNRVTLLYELTDKNLQKHKRSVINRRINYLIVIHVSPFAVFLFSNPTFLSNYSIICYDFPIYRIS